jgi:hypothetical protein
MEEVSFLAFASVASVQFCTGPFWSMHFSPNWVSKEVS